MGNQLATSGIGLSFQELHLQDVGEGVVEQRKLGGGRLLKSVQCWQDGRYLVVKVYLKKDDDPPQALAPHAKAINKFNSKLSLERQPNILPYQKLVETEGAGYLVRQYLYSNLAERISTRPFPSRIGKKWIAFQILKAVAQLHEAGLYHGDLKAENVLLTGWDWVFLADMAPYKPVTLPAGNPADFSYYFDTSRHRTCCIAPERFYYNTLPSDNLDSGVGVPIQSASFATTGMLQTTANNVSNSNSFENIGILGGTGMSLGNASKLRKVNPKQHMGLDINDDDDSTIFNDQTQQHQSTLNESEDETDAFNRPRVTEAMDIFSAGCVLAQMFFDGDPMFDLGQLLAYRKGDYDITTTLNRIEDPHVRHLIKHMLQVDPQKRFTAVEYLEKWTGTVFPSYFEELHTHILSHILTLDSDDRIECIWRIYDALLQVTSEDRGRDKNDLEEPLEREDYLDVLYGTSLTLQEKMAQATASPDRHNAIGKKSVKLHIDVPEAASVSPPNSPSLPNLMKATKKFLHHQRALQEAALGGEPTFVYNDSKEQEAEGQSAAHDAAGPPWEKQSNRKSVPSARVQQIQEGMELIAALVCSSVRNAKASGVRAHGLIVMQRLAECVPDYTRLQCLLPYTVVMLSDSDPIVRTTAIRTLAHLLGQVTIIPASEAHLFNEYLLPALGPLTQDSSEIVRTTFAEHLATFAHHARRFLEMAQLIKQESISKSVSSEEQGNHNFKGTYDSDLNLLQDEFANLVLQLSTDPSSFVKRALLQDITKLCVFFGRRRTNDFVLPMVITFLNSKEWELRQAFFGKIVGVSVFVGPISLKEFILPCILQALNGRPDVEEFVVDQALKSLVSLCEMGMFHKHTLVDMASKITPLLYHPNTWIRYDAIAFFAAASKQLGVADTSCFLIPILAPHLDYNLMLVSERSLLESIKPPIPRLVFDKALSVAFKISESTSEPNKQSSQQRWEELLSMKVSQEEAEKLDVMKTYLESTSKAIMAKNLWAEPKADGEDDSEVITLDIPVKTQYVLAETPAREQPLLPSGRTSQHSKQGRQEFHNEWNTMFSKPTAKQLASRRRQRSEALPFAPGSPASPIAGSVLSTSSPTASSLQSVSLSGSPAISSALTQPPAGAANPSNAPSINIFGTTDKAPVTASELAHFRPAGQLIAQAHEHRGSINEIAVHDSMAWFATAGSDGTVRLWDARNIDRDSALMAQLTYSMPGFAGKVLSLTISHSFSGAATIAASTSKGWIHLFSAEFGATLSTARITEDGAEFVASTFAPADNPHYQQGAISVVRQCNYNTHTPLIVCGTQSGALVAIDPRAGKEAWVWKELHAGRNGPISALYHNGESDGTWMVSGTKRGFLTLWDIRFQMAVSSWKAVANDANSSSNGNNYGMDYHGGAINSIAGASFAQSNFYSTYGANDAPFALGTSPTAAGRKRSTGGSNGEPYVYVCGSGQYNEVSLWNLATQRRVAVFRASHNQQQQPGVASKISSSPNMGDDLVGDTSSPPHSGRRSNNNTTATTTSSRYLLQPPLQPTTSNPAGETRALYVFPESGGIITGGTDRRIRYWDVCRPSQSYVVCGLELWEKGARYYASELPAEKNCVLVQEEIIGRNFSTNSSTTTTTTITNTNTSSATTTSITSGSPFSPDSTSRHDVISSSSSITSGSSSSSSNGGGAVDQNAAIRRGGTFSLPVPTSHADCITDIKVLCTPAQGGTSNANPLITLLSASRDGIVKCWR